MTTMYLRTIVVIPVLLGSGTLLPAAGPPEVVNDTTLRWQGRTLHAIDGEGVFFATVDSVDPGRPLPEPDRTLPEIIGRRGQHEPVICQLIDYVDCTTKTHDFHERSERGEGTPSNVLEIAGKRFRVTGLPAEEGQGRYDRWRSPYFEYTFKTADEAGAPHLIVYEMPDDRERYATVSLTVPDGVGRGIPWSPPYTGQEAVQVDATQISQEPFWYEPDVGLCVYTGRDLPLAQRTFLSHFIFYPKAARITARVSSSSLAPDIDERSGAAVSAIWIFRILDDLAERRPVIEPPKQAPQRRIGLYTTHPWYYLAHYGAPPHTVEQRRASFESLCDLLAFCGMNLIEFNAINGSDRAGRAWYPGSYYKQLGADLLSELPPVAAERGIDIIPVVTSITVPGKTEGNRPNEFGFSEMSLQRHYDPKADPRAFNAQAPDPLRPETQRWLIRHLVEIAQRSREHRNVTGIGFRVNGKIGTCYISGEDKSGGQTRVRGAGEMGYSLWDLSQFRRETRLRVPADSLAAYEWLKADPERWDKWLDFRCRRTRAFWLEARDAIRKVRPDWTLYVLTDLPSEMPATNIDWPGPGAPDAERISLDLLRGHGYDPRLFKQDEGIVIQRVMMVDSERIHSTRWGPPWGSNPTRYRDFHEQGFLPAWYGTPAGAATEIYHSYWEESGHPDIWEFGPDGAGYGMRTATAIAKGRAFYRPAAFTLRAGNSDTIVFNGWERPVLGHEHDLRRFCQAFRALPVAAPRALKTTPANEKITAAWYGDRIGVINDTPKPQLVTVTLDEAIPAGKQLRDVATGHVLIDASSAQRDALAVEMEDYDVRTLVVEPPPRQ